MAAVPSHWSGYAAALAELARQARTDTLLILEQTPETHLTWSPRGTRNHILWHAGHCVCVGDVLGVELLSGKSELPPGWNDLFAMGSDPEASRRTPPARERVVELLHAQHRRLLVLLAAATEADLTRTVWERFTVADRIVHGLHDEARHSGEMYLLLKMIRAGTPAAG